MTESERRRSEGRAVILKALAHPSRLLIVEKLAEKSYCVCELTAMIGADTSTVSKHLSILRNAGVISDRKQGTSVYYSLEAPCLMRLLDCVESVIEQNLKRQLSYLKA
jgi:DNA-binding transcriptional ArsR family regulator